MVRALFCVLVAALLASCGSPSDAPPPAEQDVEAAVTPPPDESRRFPRTNRVSMELVDNHLLGKNFLPGGNLATYETGGKKYQQFLINGDSPNDVTFLMMDFKDNMEDVKFVPSFGGYFGLDGDTPVFLFPSGNYLAGITGLPEEEADTVARDFAARLN